MEFVIVVDTMEEYGYTIIPDILSNEDYETFESMFFDDSAKIIPGFDKNDKKTWNYPSGVKGIIRSYGFSHTDSAWFLRTRPSFQREFAKLHGTDDLVVSFDSFIVKTRPCKIDPWFHRDQEPDFDRPSYQGIYYHYECGEDDPGTLLVPKSHTEKNSWENSTHGKNWLMVPECIQNEVLKKATKPKIPKNSLLIFNSRLIHASSGGKNKFTDRLERLCFCVSYTPRFWRSEETLERKKQAYIKGQSSAHWADDNFRILKAGQFEHKKGLIKYQVIPKTYQLF